MNKKQVIIGSIISVVVLFMIVISIHYMYVRHIKWILTANKIEAITVNKYAILSYIGQIICTFLSFINLVLILVFFMKDRKYKLKEQMTINKTHWFTDLIYEKNIKYVEEFFEESINIIEVIYRIPNQQENNNCIMNKKAEFAKLSRSIENLSNKFIGLVEIIDSKLSVELDKLLEKYQDELTDKLEKVGVKKNEMWFLRECTEIVNKYKKEFIKKLYTYNIQLYK